MQLISNFFSDFKSRIDIDIEYFTISITYTTPEIINYVLHLSPELFLVFASLDELNNFKSKLETLINKL